MVRVEVVEMEVKVAEVGVEVESSLALFVEAAAQLFVLF